MNTRLLLGGLSAIALMAAAPARFVDGYTVVMKVTPAAGGESRNITFKLAGDKMRLEMDMSQMGGGGGRGMDMSNAYMLWQPGGKMAMVTPMMAIVIDAGGLFGGGAAGGGRGMMAPVPEATDVSVTVDDLGAGEQIAGHSTHKYRLHSKYTANAVAHDVTTDIWMTTDFAGSESAFGKMGQLFAGSGGGAKLGDAVSGKMPRGLPMKIVATTERGASTMEVQDIKKLSFADSDFEIPAGVRVMDMGAMMNGRRGGGN